MPIRLSRFEMPNAVKKDEATAAGTYTHTEYNSTTGCNDLYRLILTVDSSEYHFEQGHSMCQNDSYTWPINGTTYANLPAGVYDYYKEFQTISGKDSIYHLTLTVHPIVRTTEMVEFVSFPARYRGYEFTTAGEAHEFTFTTANGCDSIVNVIANSR